MGDSESVLGEAGLKKAYSYACEWGQSNNESSYFRYGEDSANFASQVLTAGGEEKSELFSWNSQEAWYTKPPFAVGNALHGTPPLHALAWSSPAKLYTQLIQSGKAEIEPEQSEASTRAGDLIFWKWNPVAGQYSDVSMVVSGDGTKPSSEVVASHIPDSGDVHPEEGDGDDGANGAHDEMPASLPGLTNMQTLLGDLGPYLNALTTFNSKKYGTTSLCPSSDTGSGGAEGKCWKWTVLRVISKSQPHGPNAPSETNGGVNPSENEECQPCNGDPVDAATGEFVESKTDFTIPGRGQTINLTRTYGSLSASVNSPFGYAWTGSYNMSISNDPLTATVKDIHQEDGSVVRFGQLEGEAGPWTAVEDNTEGKWVLATRVLATLVKTAEGWTFTRMKTAIFKFNTSGQLVSESDVNGDTTTLTYNASKELEKVKDAGGRQLTFSYSAEHVSQVEDSAGRTVKYHYDEHGNLTEVTDVTGAVTKYGYDSAHHMTSMTTPNGGVTTNTYDSSGRVTAQTDPLGHTTSWSYNVNSSLTGSTAVTEPSGEVTLDSYTNGDLTTSTHGLETSSESTKSYAYDTTTNEQQSVTEPNGTTTTSSYNTSGNRLSETNPKGQTTKWTYNEYGEVTSMTPPATYGGKTVTTTYTYDQPEYSSGGAGNLTTVSTPILNSTGESLGTQVTHYVHGSSAHPGDVTSMIDPRGNTWTYAYDSYGDKTSETTPATSDNSESSGSHQNVTKWAYNALTGWQTAKLSGRYTLAHPSESTCTSPATGCTTYTYDNEGRLLITTDGNGHTTTKHYDGDGNVEYEIDAKTNKTTFVYNLIDQMISTTRPDKSVTETKYASNGQVEDQIDAAKDDTHYTYNEVGELTGVTDPNGRTTSYQYGPSGELLAKADPGVIGCTPSAKIDGCTTYEYNSEGREIGIHYNDPSTHDVTIGYDTSGRRTSLSDASGISSWTYDSLGRVTSTTNGAGATIGYGYDPAGGVTSITYPSSTGTVKRAYDQAGRIGSITDWKSNTTSFQYDAEGNLAKGTDPTTGTAVTDTYTFDPAGAISVITTAQGSSTLSSFSYKRDQANQVTEVASTGVPSDNHTYGYNPLEQLSSIDTSEYIYDAADRPKELPSGATQVYDSAGQLMSATTGSAGINYGFDAKGERASATPNPASIASGYAYGYNQAGELASVSRSPATGHASLAVGGGTVFLARDDGTVTAAGLNASGQLGDGTKTEHRSPIVVPGLNGIKSVTVGPDLGGEPGSDTLAVTGSGSLWAFGANTHGELGNGTTTQSSTPAIVSSVSNVTQAAEGENDSFAVESGWTLWAWGYNNYGQLGIGSTTNQSSPQQVTGVSKVVQVAAGTTSTIALEANGTVWDWGNNNHGQLGTGNTTNESSPQQVTSLSNVVQVASGHQFALALTSEGKVYAWGANSHGKLGIGNETDSQSPAEITALAGDHIVQIAAGQSFGAALAQNGTVYVWGSNSNGQLGREGEGSLTPIQVSGLSGVTQIDAGGNTMAVVANGTVYVWGENAHGQLGDGTITQRNVPEQVGAFNSGVRTLPALGGAAAFMVRDDGTVTAAGSNASGQLGDGTTSERSSPVSIQALSNVRQVAAGPDLGGEPASDALAVTGSGSLWAMGANTDGELGNGTTKQSSTPAVVSGVSNVTQAAEGENNSIALESGGSLWAWGLNNYGQLGIGSTSNQSSPQQVTGVSNVIQVAAGTTSTVALESNGTVWDWGNNGHGQLGIGNTTNKSSPQQVPGLSNVIQVASGHQFALALTSEGKVYAWGANSHGKLGIGSETDSQSPVEITGLSSVHVVKIAAGQSFAAALAQNGTVYVWGSNSNGQLGREGEGSLTPIQLAGLSGITQIDASGNSTAVVAGGSEYVWGENTHGQLGDGTKTERYTPEQNKSFEKGIVSTATYTYNGDGLRTSKTVNANTENFTWDNATTSIPVLLAEGSISYIYGPDGNPLEQMNSTGELLWYHHDQQGSTRTLTNNTGAVVGTATYSPYGQITATTGITTALGYDGQYTDTETGLIYLRARYYDPATAQFISIDPEASETGEPYKYGGDNPLTWNDPTGLSIFGFIEEAAPVVITVTFATACVAEVLGCAAAAILDGVANSGLMGYQVVTKKTSLATGIKNEALTLFSDSAGYIGAKFWDGLTQYAEENKLLGKTSQQIARNKLYLNSPGKAWSVAQAATYLYLEKKEKKCLKR